MPLFSPPIFFLFPFFFSLSLSGMSYTAIVTYANNNFSSGTLQQGRSAFRPQLAYTQYNKEKRKREKSSRLRMHLISRAMIFIWLTVTMHPCNYVTVLKNFRSFSLALPFFLPLSPPSFRSSLILHIIAKTVRAGLNNYRRNIVVVKFARVSPRNWVAKETCET